MDCITRTARIVRGMFMDCLKNKPTDFGEGKWVAPAKGVELTDPNQLDRGICFGYHVIRHDEVQRLLLEDSESEANKLFVLISDKPFLVIQNQVWKIFPKGPDENFWTETAEGFNVSRMSRNGAAGKLPKILKHPYYYLMKDYPRRQRWANLQELADIVGISCQGMLVMFQEAADERLIVADVVNARVDSGTINLTSGLWRAPQLDYVHQIMFDAQLQVYEQSPEVFENRHNHGKNKVVRDCDEYSPADIFIPAGLAVNILYLSHFGYAPRRHS